MRDENDERAHRKRHGVVPMGEWDWFGDPFPKLFADPFRDMRRGMMRDFMGGFSVPRVDIKDNGDSFVVEADMPSVDKKDIELKVSDEAITIKAEREKDVERGSGSFYSRERSSSGYYRMVRLPEEVDSGSAKASYKDGTLTVEVKKAKGRSAHSVKVE